MAKIDGYYRSAITYTQNPPETNTVSSEFNYTIADNLYGNSILLYTGLIPNPNPLTAAADGDKYTAPNGVDVVEKVSAQVLDQVEDSLFGFTHSRLTYLIPGAVYGITVWSKDQAGQYTVPVPPMFYDVFFYPPAGTYVVYFKEKYAPIYQSNVGSAPSYPPAITCYRYCGLIGIENLPSPAGGITAFPDYSYVFPGTGLYTNIYNNPTKWAGFGYETRITNDIYLYDYTVEADNGWAINVYNFGTKVAVGDLGSVFMKESTDGLNWTTRDLTLESQDYALFRNSDYAKMIYDPGTNEVYATRNILTDVLLKYSADSVSHVKFTDYGGSDGSDDSHVASNGVFSFTSTSGRWYTSDFSTFNAVTGNPASGTYRLIDVSDGIVWCNPQTNLTTAYVSTDNGISYSEVTMPDKVGEYSQLSYKDGTYIFCSYEVTGTVSSKVYTSQDLVNWTLRNTNFTDTERRKSTVNVAPDTWIAFNQIQTSEISVSTNDGATWQIKNLPDSTKTPFDAIKVGSNYYLFTYDNNTVEVSLYKSTDLNTWTFETTTPTKPIFLPYYYKWSAIGNTGYLFYTVFDGKIIIAAGTGIHYYDGSSWTTYTEDSYLPIYYGIVKLS